MAGITDKQFIKFVNEVVRPLSETLRKVRVLCESASDDWDDLMRDLVSAHIASDPVEDGREDRGDSRLTKNDVKALIDVAKATLATLEKTGNRAIIAKPTVRKLEIT